MIATSTVFTALLSAGSALLLLAGAMLSRHKKRAAQGELDLVNRLASVERSLEPEGIVLVRGELWRARTRTGEKIGRGQTNARVVAARGTWLEVEACGVAPAPSSFPLLSSIKKSASVGRW